MIAYAGVIGRILREIEDLDRLVGRAQALDQLATRTGRLEVLDGVALNLHTFYSSVERVFEAIARDVDGGLPSGPEWHRELLTQMSAALPGVREPVITEATATCLDMYRSFRHVVRNAYTHNLRPDRIRELVGELPACTQAVRTDLEAFCRFLMSLAE